MKIEIKKAFGLSSVELVFSATFISSILASFVSFAKSILKQPDDLQLMMLSSFIIAFLIVVILGYLLIENRKIRKTLYSLNKKTERTQSIVEDKLLNDFKGALTKAMYRQLKNLNNRTLAEKALWSYFRNKLEDVHHRYMDFKNGAATESNELFKRDLIGSGTGELHSLYSHWNPEFLNMVEIINLESVENFLLQMKLSNSKNYEEKLSSLKLHGEVFFENNVEKILTAYREYPPLLDNTVEGFKQIDIDYLKTLINSGLQGVEKVINVLMTCDLNTSKKDILIQLSSRFHELQIKRLKGVITYNDIEFNRITADVLNFLTLLKKDREDMK
jgi:hypothetical protein